MAEEYRRLDENTIEVIDTKVSNESKADLLSQKEILEKQIVLFQDKINIINNKLAIINNVRL